MSDNSSTSATSSPHYGVRIGWETIDVEPQEVEEGSDILTARFRPVLSFSRGAKMDDNHVMGLASTIWKCPSRPSDFVSTKWDAAVESLRRPTIQSLQEMLKKATIDDCSELRVTICLSPRGEKGNLWAMSVERALYHGDFTEPVKDTWHRVEAILASTDNDRSERDMYRKESRDETNGVVLS